MVFVKALTRKNWDVEGPSCPSMNTWGDGAVVGTTGAVEGVTGAGVGAMGADVGAIGVVVIRNVEKWLEHDRNPNKQR